MSLQTRWDAVCQEVARACEEAGRDPGSVKIVAVSKTVGPGTVAEAIGCGMTDFGENRTKPFREKQALYPDATWHFIGNLQSNKVKDVVGYADLIHSVDRPSLLAAIQKHAAKAGIVQDVLVEVSVSGEKSKGGIAPDELSAFLRDVEACPNLRCRGLMTMAPQGDSALARETFAGLRKLAENMAEEFAGSDTIAMTELSMGMTEDFREAISEGATMVRIGRKIFSELFD